MLPSFMPAWTSAVISGTRGTTNTPQKGNSLLSPQASGTAGAVHESGTVIGIVLAPGKSSNQISKAEFVHCCEARYVYLAPIGLLLDP